MRLCYTNKKRIEKQFPLVAKVPLWDIADCCNVKRIDNILLTSTPETVKNAFLDKEGGTDVDIYAAAQGRLKQLQATSHRIWKGLHESRMEQNYVACPIGAQLKARGIVADYIIVARYVTDMYSYGYENISLTIYKGKGGKRKRKKN